MNFVGVSRSLGGLVLIALAGSVLLGVLLATRSGRRRLGEEVRGEVRLVLGLAGTTATVSMAGSLYFSDVVGFTPCLLCWYQRIAMYPLVVILAVGCVLADREVWRYVLPISLVGLLVSGYHYLIQWRPSLDVVTCDAAAPCTARYLSVFGFMSIPFMAGAGFLLISLLMLAIREAPRNAPADGTLPPLPCRDK